jgi:enoyl-CoA hydratase
MQYLLYEEIGCAALLTINRPDALNALNGAVLSELIAKLDEISASNIRCLIVTGAGEKSFVAGADIDEMKDLNPKQAEQFSIEGNAVMEKIENLPMPVIAAVNGFALGGGFELALACDIRLASETAVFAMPEVGLGILPGYGGVQRLTRAVGLAKAKELVFTANRVKAPEALSLGFVSAIYPAGELLAAAKQMAERIAANAPLGVRAAKKVANDSIGLTMDKASHLESRLFGECFATDDQKQAMAAFLEKKKPEPFTGR